MSKPKKKQEKWEEFRDWAISNPSYKGLIPLSKESYEVLKKGPPPKK